MKETSLWKEMLILLGAWITIFTIINATRLYSENATLKARIAELQAATESEVRK